jgi:Delta3-Delta2-enoyl-CoA isomerase
VKGVRIESQQNLAVLRLDKERGNSIDPSLVEGLLEAARQLQADPGVRGVLLASAHPKLFCPGLDLITLIELERPAMRAFMSRFAEMMWTLFGLRKPMVAAVNGHAVAGGCILALTADHRVLRRGAQIGLNEVRIGLPLPWSVALLLRHSAHPGAVSRVALLGNNFAEEEAVAVGLAHEVAEADGFESLCLARLQELAERDASALATTKAYLRADVLDQMKAQETARMDEFLDAWFAPATRERMRELVASLGRPR